MFASLEAKLFGFAILVLGLIAGYEWIKSQGASECRADFAVAVAKQKTEADATTDTLKESAHVLALANAAKNTSIDARYAADLQRLRNRPSVQGVPQVASAAASDGHVGGLPIGDSGLLGIGARAAKLQSKLAECQAWIAKAVGVKVPLEP